MPGVVRRYPELELLFCRVCLVVSYLRSGKNDATVGVDLEVLWSWARERVDRGLELDVICCGS